MSPLDSYETEVLAAYENDAIKPNGSSRAELEKYREAAAITFFKTTSRNHLAAIDPLALSNDKHVRP
jgi:hypothetical protein